MPTRLKPILALFGLLILFPISLKAQFSPTTDGRTCSNDAECEDSNPCTQNTCRFLPPLAIDTTGSSRCASECLQSVAGGTCSQEGSCTFTPTFILTNPVIIPEGVFDKFRFIDRATVADIQISPAPIVFSTLVGQSSVIQVTLSKRVGTGSDPLVSTINIIGTNASNFNTVKNDCSGRTLTDTTVCNIDLQFSPPSVGNFTATLQVQSTSTAQPTTDALIQGQGITQAQAVNCGNGSIEPPELCDGNNLNSQTCESVTGITGQTGTLTCNTDCTFNTRNCQAPKQVLVAPTPPPPPPPACTADADCNDTNACTTDQCAQICVQTPSVAPSVGPDGIPVVGVAGETICNAQCLHLPVEIDDQNSCTTDSCEPTTGNVSHVAIPNCPPPTCGNGVLDNGEQCDFEAEGESRETCDENCKNVFSLDAVCHCNDSSLRIEKGECTKGGIDCCFPFDKKGKLSTFTCEPVFKGSSQAALTLQQKLLANTKMVVWSQTSRKGAVKSVFASEVQPASDNDVVVQAISVAPGVEPPSTKIQAFTPVPEGNGKNFEEFAMKVSFMDQNNQEIANATAKIRTAAEVSGGGGGCSLIR